MSRLEKAAIAANGNQVVISNITDGVIVADWEKKELRIICKEITIPNELEQWRIIQQSNFFVPQQWFVEVDGNLRKIGRIDVDCSDVLTKEESVTYCP